MKSVIIIPTYNERENVIILLDALHKEAKKILNHEILYVVVDDTSPDGTGEAVRIYQKSHKDTYLVIGKKEGLGRALLRGMTYATKELHAEVIIQMDCDLSHDPARIPDFLAAIDHGADFVVGSRYIKGGSIPDNWGFIRKVYSIVANAIVRFGLGHPAVHDWTGGYRAYTKKYYELANEEMKKYSGYLFQIAFLHIAINHGAHIVEVPFHFSDRKYGKSKIIPGEYIKSIFVYIATSAWNSIFHGTFGKFLVVGGTGFLINTIIYAVLIRTTKLDPIIANTIGAELAIISNYIWNNLWTFQDRGHHTIGMFIWKLVQFNLTSVIGVMLIQNGTIFLGTRLFGQTFMLRMGFYLLGTALLLVWNYIVYSKIIWKKRP
jgi:dolichol-phosphate mannosyltransferase